MKQIKAYFILLLPFLLGNSVSTCAQNWTLKQCIDTALENNLTIQQSVNAVELSNVKLLQSKANLYPSLNGSTSQSFNSSSTSNNDQTGSGNSWSNNFSVNSSVTLFDGLQNKNTIKQNKLEYEVSKYELEDNKNEIILNVIQAFLDVLYDEELVRNMENNIDATQAQLEKTQAFVDAGKKSESDLLEIKSQLASDKLSHVNAAGQLKSAKLSLQQIMNISVSNKFDIEFPVESEIASIDTTNVDAIYNSALLYQPLIKAYQLKTHSALFDLKIAKNSMSPTLTLNGSLFSNYSSLAKLSEINYQNNIQNIGYMQSDPSELVLGNVTNSVYSYSKYPFGNQLKDNMGLSLALSLSIPIFNSHTVKNNIHIQKINLNNAILNEQGIKNDLRKKIEQAFIDVENSISNYNAAQEQVTASAASYQNSISKYENGMMNISDILIEINKNTKAQSEFVQAKYQLIYNLKILDFYKGSPLIFN
jgi:outer membrane protein